MLGSLIARLTVCRPKARNCSLFFKRRLPNSALPKYLCSTVQTVLYSLLAAFSPNAAVLASHATAASEPGCQRRQPEPKPRNTRSAFSCPSRRPTSARRQMKS